MASPWPLAAPPDPGPLDAEAEAGLDGTAAEGPEGFRLIYPRRGAATRLAQRVQTAEKGNRAYFSLFRNVSPAIPAKTTGTQLIPSSSKNTPFHPKRSATEPSP